MSRRHVPYVAIAIAVAIVAIAKPANAGLGFALFAVVIVLAAGAVLQRLTSETTPVGPNRVTDLEQLAGALAEALTPDDVAQVVVERGAKVMGADICTLYALDATRESLELLGDFGVAPAVLEKIERITAESENPVWATLESGEELWIETGAEYEKRFPAVAKIDAKEPRAQAFWSMPLVVEGRPIGLLGMGFHEARSFSEEERRFVQAFARQCAQALLRALRLGRETAARLAAEEARAEIERDDARRALLTQAIATLAVSLDYKTTLAHLASTLVPKLADWCAIEMIDETTGQSAQLAVAHEDPEMVKHAWDLRRRYPPDPNATNGVPNVLRTARSEIWPEITDEMLVATAIDEEHLRISRELLLRSALIVPLVARGKTLGAITMVHSQSGRRYTNDDLEIAEEIARSAASAVDNARLYGAEQAARAHADEANRLKDDFLATVSHELRTPLNAILGWSRMINGRALDEAKVSRANETIERNALAMTQLIEDLLDVSRIISGKMRLEVETVDIVKVVEAAVDSIRPAAAAKELVVRAVLDPTPGAIVGDPNRLQQVVWNILSNAVKFTPKAGTIDVALRRQGSAIEIAVSDTGSGIASELVPFVFDRFRQGDGSHTRQYGGLGLGLAITKQLVELHGGTVRASSEGVGKGSTFTVELPTDVARARLSNAKASVAQLAQARGETLAGLRVLAVDDDEDARELVRTVLEREGAIVTLAGSVDEALELFTKEPPDVLLSDVGMPGKDGVELILRVRERPADRGGRVPAAALTAYVRAADRTRVLSAGYLMHLPKPIEPAELVSVVASLAKFRIAI